jgi:thimet oligopeptidase
MHLSSSECLLTFLIAVGPSIIGEAAVAQEAPNAKYYQWASPARIATRVQQRTFESAAVGSAVSYHIYVPAIYDSATTQRFPVVYWLHGSGGGGPGLPLVAARLDSAIRAGKMPPMLVVFPNGLLMGMWVDWKSGRVPMETVVIKELIPHIDATFRTIPSREARLIEGFSMGGYGAARLAFKYPDLFGAVSVLAGGPLQRELTAAAATTAVRATPEGIQMVLDTIYGGDQEYFKAQSPWQLAERNTDAVRRLRIRQVVGENDSTLAANRDLHDHLTRLKIPHEFIVLPRVPHNPRQVFDALGERHLGFYRDAFAAVVRREHPSGQGQPNQQPTPWRDTARHAIRFISVAPGVKLEVLDWGGSGPPVVLLAGLGNTAHSFDEFAPELTNAFHVYGVTRRGFGGSSHPGTGYDVPTLTADLATVLDSLRLTNVALIGHSIAGDEMTRLAATHPERLSRLVYLDAAHDRTTGMSELRAARLAPPPPPPPMTAADSASPASVRAYYSRMGTPLPESEIRATQLFGTDGRVQRFLTPDSVTGAIARSVEPPAHAKIKAPALAIYPVHDSAAQLPWYSQLDSAGKVARQRILEFNRARVARQRDLFEREVTQGRTEVIHGAGHYAHLTHQREVIALMRGFLSQENPRDPSTPFYSGVVDEASLTQKVEGHLARAAELRASLLTVSGRRTPENTLRVYDDLRAELLNATGLTRVVQGLHPEQRMRTTAELLARRLASFERQIASDRRIYDALAAIDSSKASPEVRLYLRRELAEYRRQGIDRDSITRGKLEQLRGELLAAEQEYRRNIREGVRRFQVQSVAELEGLPADFIAGHPPDATGRITLTTEVTDAGPVMTYARSDELRRRMYMESGNVAIPANVPVLRRMLELRHQIARTLGYANWASYDFQGTMAGTPADVGRFLDRVVEASAPAIERDGRQLLARKRVDHPGANVVESWEASYYAALVRKTDYDFDTREIRPYLAYEGVRDGLLQVTRTLFGFDYVRVHDVPVWHPSVEVYDVMDEGRRAGRIYLDTHPRPGKAGTGALTIGARRGRRGLQLPEIVLAARLPGGRPGDPGLMTPANVTVLFHEFGHVVHFLSARNLHWTGHRLEPDFFEVPSQLLEEWALEPSILATFARHYQTNEPVPASLVQRMRRANGFGRGAQARSAGASARFSLSLHDRDPAGLKPNAMYRDIRNRYLPNPYPDGVYEPAHDGQLSNANISARRYRYLWGEVIVKDLFSQFDPANLLDPAIARRYRKAILEPWASKPAMELVQDFLGRPADLGAWQRWLKGEERPPQQELEDGWQTMEPGGGTAVAGTARRQRAWGMPEVLRRHEGREELDGKKGVVGLYTIAGRAPNLLILPNNRSGATVRDILSLLEETSITIRRTVGGTP